MAIAPYILKRHDTYPPLSATLTDSIGAINLSTATLVKFYMKGRVTNTVVTGTCTITDAPNGKVSYAWVSPNTDVSDTYDVEFQITWTGGGKQTVPNATAANPTVEIDDDIDNV